jgi:hypothetical protein
MTLHCPTARATRALCVAVALAAFAATSTAQTPAPAPATAAAPAPYVLAKPNCGTMPEHPGGLGSENQKRQWRKAGNEYLECFNKYVVEQRALATRHLEAANALIDEYNTAVKEMQAAIDAAAR